jgi:hypothetical protein
MLLSFPAPDADQPFSRKALIRNFAEADAIRATISKREGSRAMLEGELARVPEAERNREEALDHDAQTLLSRLKDGLTSSLAAFGKMAGDIDARLAASRHQGAIAQRAICSLDAEIAEHKGKLVELEAVRPELIASCVAEAAQGVCDDYATAIENARDAMVRLAGLEGFLGITRIGRIVGVMPDFYDGDFSEQPVIAPNREIEKARAAFVAYAEALSHDPRAPVSCLALPPIDPSPDDDTIYSDMTPIERARVDAQFSPPETRQRPTEDSIALAEAIAGQIEDFHSRVTA